MESRSSEASGSSSHQPAESQSQPGKDTENTLFSPKKKV